MDCPSCATPIRGRELPDGSTDFSCPKCGWGKVGGTAHSRDDAPKKPSAGRVMLFLFAALLIVIGPYAAMIIGIRVFMGDAEPAFADAADRLIGLINLHYWWIMAVYIFLAAAFSPTWDRDNVGWLGGMIDNPFSLQDDWERSKRTFAFLLLPGKVVVYAARLMWSFATAKA